MNQKHREEAIAALARNGMGVDLARKLLRYGTTLDRLAVALCNGDYPCDNGERKTKMCPSCQSGYAPASFRKGVCPDCRTTELAKAAVPEGWNFEINGDPRGAVFAVTTPSGERIVLG